MTQMAADESGLVAMAGLLHPRMYTFAAGVLRGVAFGFTRSGLRPPVPFVPPAAPSGGPAKKSQTLESLRPYKFSLISETL